jgi:hypothetical protein
VDFIVSRIEASRGSAPYVYLSYFKGGTDKTLPECPCPDVATFTSPENLMRNLPKAMANIGKAKGGGGFPTDSPTFEIIINTVIWRQRLG